MFFKIQLFLYISPQQVPDLLIIDLKIGCMDKVLHVLAGVNGLKDVLKGPGDDTPLCGGVGDTLHGEGFATAGLTIGKHSSIVAFQYSLSNIK